MGELDKAVECYRDALLIDPDFADSNRKLGMIFQSQGKLAEAAESYRNALQADPNSLEINTNLGIVLITAGNASDAVNHFRRAIRIKEDALVSLNALSWILATDPDSNMRNADEAVLFAERAANLTEYDNPGVLDTLAAAYAASGDFAKAIETAEKAITIAESTGNENLTTELEKHLEFYKQSKAYIGLPPE